MTVRALFSMGVSVLLGGIYIVVTIYFGIRLLEDVYCIYYVQCI